MSSGQRPSHLIKPVTGPDDPELLETLQEALGQASAEHLVAVAGELAARRDRFAELFDAAGQSGSLTGDDLRWIARSVTATRHQAAELAMCLDRLGGGALIDNLLHDDRPAPERVALFAERLTEPAIRLGLELATGLLHYTAPRDHWLWLRWMWDVRNQTGILPLLAGSVHNLRGASLAEEYVKVGSVTAMSMRFAEGTGLITPELTADPHRGPFAADVFLAAAYSIYLYGITNWRLSREFNRLLPPLPNLMRRLLGLAKPDRA